ncbi:uncharacterized protein LOC114315493 [Camellia sinensis]|uniref:uncharacterized protein LOC114315493 n=1 Tax=Camellia sinensis TaxID=4442 RepID=UPI0010365D7B|nr:uncharacterized protein LOC114315493 [Camellia sinensis]
MQCVSTITFAVFANGTERTSFRPSRGLRQGDPLSPYLFILVIEVLSKLLHKSLRALEFSGIQPTRTCPTLSHLFFADDALLFLQANVNQCHKILKVLDVYNTASGQRINFGKSGIQFSQNIGLALKRQICDVMNIVQVKEGATYLGLPTCWGRSKTEAYNLIVERVREKLQEWKLKLLSHAGWEILIKSVTQSILTFAMACFLFPKKLCAELNSLLSNFWWKGDPESRGIHWDSWDTMSMSKLKGGMDFRNFNSFNKALLARQGWQLCKYPHSLCAQFLKGLYYPHSDFWNARKGTKASWAWASILEGREVLNRGVRWQVCNGQSIDFWTDKWVTSSPNFHVKSRPPAGCSVSKVNEAINPNTKSWNKALLHRLVSSEEAAGICATPIAIVNQADRLIWHHDLRGNFSVKSGIERNSSINSLKPCATDALCPICHKDTESVEHLLCGCEWTRAAWFGSSLSIPFAEGTIGSIQQWTCEVYQAIKNKHDRVDYVCKMLWLAWYIWKNMNNFVFNHHPIDPVATIFAAEKSFCESASHFIHSPHSPSLSSPARDAPRAWSPPLPGRFKAKCDVAIKPDSSRAYMAILIQDSKGSLMDGVVRMEEVGSVMQGEAMAIKWACLLTRDLNLSQVEIVSDNKEVIRLCVSKDVPPWSCAPIIEDICSLANQG